jgi:hypothetical protein
MEETKTGWIPLEDEQLIVGDVVRWKEFVYAPRRSRKAKPQRLGERFVAAEVVKANDGKGWIGLLVRKCEILAEFAVRKPPLISVGTEVTRSIKTVLRGKPERLLWSDESARAIVMSKFLSGDN